MLEPNPTKRLADHNVLTTIFREFAREHFEPAHLPTLVLNVLSQQTEMSRWRFRQRLRRVKRICATGNLDLWMRLPETTPRQMWFPFCSLRYRSNCIKNHISKTIDSFIATAPEVKRNLVDILKCLSIVILFILAFIVAIIGLHFLISDLLFLKNLISDLLFLKKSYHYSKEPFFLFFVLSAILFVLFYYLITKLIDHQFKPLPPKLLTGAQFTKYSYIAQLCYLLLHGRKTIATVVAIEYIYPNRTYLPYRLQSTDHIMPKYHACESPCFCIRYKFNPPDDSEADAIIHEIFLDNDIQSSLVIGAPLPILYVVHPENVYVSSMPFPFPKHSFKKNRTYCCITSRGENVSHIYDEDIPMPF